MSPRFPREHAGATGTGRRARAGTGGGTVAGEKRITAKHTGRTRNDEER
ncbi:hypothetical protein [Streptosporangium sp. LJ11]